MPSIGDLQAAFGAIDIYLFDQLLRGRIRPGMRVLDAGCGSGRNLTFLLGAGIEVFATDEDPRAIARVRRMAAGLAPALPPDNFRVEPVERCSFPPASFDVVISSAVLHFARDDAQFTAMVDEMWRVLSRDGLFFCRLASTIGMADRMQRLEGRRFLLPRRLRALPGRCRAARRARPPAGCSPRRSDQDHRRRGAAVHDDVGGPEVGMRCVTLGRHGRRGRLRRVRVRRRSLRPRRSVP
jgi:tellurite methyltransferase